ncbi:predicted protein [Postia placenta Mad-698-R]|nr:predicted protein [Postia placenta Mad-698-R]
MREKAPTFWYLLESAACSTKRQKRNSHKRSNKRLLGVYFKFKGLSAKGFDTLHALGITMSFKWMTNAVEKLSHEAMKEVQALVDGWTKKTEFGSGTAATVYIRKDAPLRRPGLNQELEEWRARGMKNPISEADIHELISATSPSVQRQMIYHVLRVLLDAPEFHLDTYAGKNSSFLKPPMPIEALPCGPDHITMRYMLGSMPIPGATYDDDDRVLSALWTQMGYKTKADLKKLGEQNIEFIIGDQLTADRIRGLQRFRCQERNSFDRLDFVIPVFGWLYLQMAFAKSLHKQYLGTNADVGLKQAFTILERKGLDQASTKGPFHDNLERVLYHILEAHIRACWHLVANVEHIEDLRKLDPVDLLQLAEKLSREDASTDAIMLMKRTGKED